MPKRKKQQKLFATRKKDYDFDPPENIKDEIMEYAEDTLTFDALVSPRHA